MQDKLSILTNRRGRYALGIFTILLFAAVFIMNTSTAKAEEITVYKSPTCGCCTKWVSHLQSNGFKVNAYNLNDMPSVKQQFGIAPAQQSCHTAVVGGYVIEGHVPAADIRRLLTEKPNIHGLTAPGMPMGSPGMEGPHKDAYDVLAIDKQGKTTVFSQH
ncbi:MAG: DUF411 domain-containing protein [Gammaproteobacteria bacterium]|nr:DUF411 domain-containing protein [Gammaproteobacteria bacterium]